MKFRPFSALGYKLAQGHLPRLLFIHGWIPIIILPLLLHGRVEKGVLDYAFMLGCLAPAFIGLLWLLVNLAFSILFFLLLRTIEVQDQHLVCRSLLGRKLCNLPIDKLTAGFNHQSFKLELFGKDADSQTETEVTRNTPTSPVFTLPFDAVGNKGAIELLRNFLAQHDIRTFDSGESRADSEVPAPRNTRLLYCIAAVMYFVLAFFYIQK